MRKIIFFLIALFLVPSLRVMAEESTGNSSTYYTTDTLRMGDSAIIITTVCAPICSSIARVCTYDNKEWKTVRLISTPDSTWVFPEAYIDDRQTLQWRDNTHLLLDEEGR